MDRVIVQRAVVKQRDVSTNVIETYLTTELGMESIVERFKLQGWQVPINRLHPELRDVVVLECFPRLYDFSKRQMVLFS